MLNLVPLTNEDTMAKQTKTYSELKAERDKLNEQLEEMFEQTKGEFRTRIETEASELGIDLYEIYGERPLPRSKKGSDVVVKYRHPDDPKQTWSGRGRPSRWLQELIDAGHDKEKYRV